MLQSMGSQRVGHDWVTEQQQNHEYSRFSTYRPSSCDLSRMRTCIPSTSGVSEITACPPSPIADHPSAVPSPTSSPTSPPSSSNSSSLFTLCQPLYASCCTILLCFSRYCTVRLKCFLHFLLFFFYVLFVGKVF